MGMFDDLNSTQESTGSGMFADLQPKGGGASGGWDAPRKWSDVPMEALRNTPQSAGHFVGGLANAVMHPIDTLTGLGDAMVGGTRKIAPSLIGVIDKFADPSVINRQNNTANALGGAMKDRYGSMDGVKNTLATDPVGALADLSTVLTGGAAAATKAPMVSSALQKAATLTNPLSVVAPAARGLGRVVETPASAVLGVSTGVGQDTIRNAAKAGFNKDASFMNNISGKTGMSDVLDTVQLNLQNMGAKKAADYRSGKIDIKNTAAVMVTAELPGFAKPGQKIDVTVSAIGKASNLRGGTLLLTSLRGVDGEIYAISQGSLAATGIDATAAAGSKVVIGVPTSARIPQGATVERIVDNPFDKADRVILNVRDSDFTTTTAIVNVINTRFGADVARAMDGVTVSLQAPQDLTQRVAFMSMVENMDVMPGEPSARVVVNARTGTVVISRNVRVTAAAVSHGTISVSVAVTNEISQPGPFSNGTTAAVQNAEVAVSEPNKPMFMFNPGVDLRQIVDAVNQVGATPSALIAILEALKSAGSLRADLLVI